MASPKPQPVALKLLQGRGPGTDSGGRPVKNVPGFERAAPLPPAWLPAEARAEWERVVPALDRLGILRRIDAAALTGYCMTWHRFVEASAIVQREGTICTAHDNLGNVKLTRHPALLTAEAASKELRAWAGEFGLTPSAEHRLAGTKGDDGDQGNPFAAPAHSA